MTAPIKPDDIPPLPASMTEEAIPELPSSLRSGIPIPDTPRPVADVTAQQSVVPEIGLFDPLRAVKLEQRRRENQGLPTPGTVSAVDDTNVIQELGRFIRFDPRSNWWRRIMTPRPSLSQHAPRGPLEASAQLAYGMGAPTVGEVTSGALDLGGSVINTAAIPLGARPFEDASFYEAANHGIKAVMGTTRLVGGFAEGLVNGFVTDAVRLAYDAGVGGANPIPGMNLLPEERTQLAQNVVMNYGGLAIGGGVRTGLLENQAMRQLAAEAGVSRGALRNVLTEPELQLLTKRTLESAEGMGLSAHSRLIAGVQEGAIGGAGGAAVAGEDPGDVAAYGLMAAPLGVAFEAFGALKALGQERTTARDYLRLRSLQAIDDLQASTAAQAALSLDGNLDAARLWAFNAERQPGDVMVMTGVDRVNNEHILSIIDKEQLHHSIHENPNGTLDVLIGDPESLAQAEYVRKGFTDTGFMPHEIVMYDGRPHVVSSIGRAGDVTARTVMIHEVGSGKPNTVLASELTRPPRNDFAEPLLQFRTDLDRTKAIDEKTGKPLEFYRGIPDPTRPFEVTEYEGMLGRGIYLSSATETGSQYARYRSPLSSDKTTLTDAELTAVQDQVVRQITEPNRTGGVAVPTPEAAAAFNKLGQSPAVTRARVIMKNPFRLNEFERFSYESGPAFADRLEPFRARANEYHFDRLIGRLRQEGAQRIVSAFDAQGKPVPNTTVINELEFGALQRAFDGEGGANAILAELGYDGILADLPDKEVWGVVFKPEQIVSPWTESELIGTTTVPSEMAVRSRLEAVADAAISSLKERLDSDAPINFKNLVESLSATIGARPNEVPFLSNLIEQRLGAALIPELLDAQEVAIRTRLINDLATTRAEEGLGLVERALNAGLLTERDGGTVVLRNMEDGTIVGRFNSVKDANEFAVSSGAGQGTHIDGGGNSIPPRVFGGGLTDGIPPENGPHTVKWRPDQLGTLAAIRAGFNASSWGRHLTTMREFLIALDNIHGTSIYSKVYLPLQEAVLKKNAGMAPYVAEISALSKMATGLGKDSLDHIVTYLETMSPEEIVTSLFSGRKLTEAEITEAAWFAQNNVDIAKVFAYRRDVMALERNLEGAPEEMIQGALAEIRDNHNMTPADIEATRRINEAINRREPNAYSPYAIVRLANALMNKELSRADFVKKLGKDWTPQMAVFTEQTEALFKKGADEFDIPDERRLTNYFSHYRKYDLNEPIPSKDGTPRFVSDLQRVGEMSEIDRDPISVLMRYFNTGFGERYLAEPLKEARGHLNSIAKFNPTWGPQVRETVLNNYVNELRGIPKDDVALTQGFFDKLLGGMGIHGVKGSRDLVNTVLSLSSSSALGARPMQAARDLSSFTQLYYARFGAARTARMFNEVGKWTPKQLYEAGILESPPKTVAGLPLDIFGGPQVAREMAEQGIIPTNNPIRVLSATEQQQTQLLGGAGRFRRGVQTVADIGMKWSFQHTVFQWAHAATYLESLRFTTDVLTDLGLSRTTKEAAYKKLQLSTYDRAVQRQFNTIVTDGRFEEAAKFLAQTTAAEVIPTFGLGNAPMGWTSNAGRLVGQFGFYPTWARSQFSRMFTQGTLRDRALAMSRAAIATGATKAASFGLGVSMASWYLPYAAGAVNAAETLQDALNTPQGESTRSKLLTRSMWQFALGVPGSAMFGGGPVTTVLRSGLELGDPSAYNDDAAVARLQRMWLLGVPGGYQARDILRAIQLQKMGYNPVTVAAQAFGLQPLEEPSPLNPGGVERP